MDSPLKNRRVAFVGKLGGLTKKEAMQMVREHEGIPVDRSVSEVDWIVYGADQDPSTDPIASLTSEWKDRVEKNLAELISETELWRRLGMVEHHQNVWQLYTPAMLADLLKVPIRNIRRWQKLGLIRPVRIVHRLPYFDFEEVQNARQLAGWLSEGASLGTIRKQLREIAERSGSEEGSNPPWNFVVEGKQLLLRIEQGLVEPCGQLRMDFDSLGDEGVQNEHPQVLSVDPTRFLGRDASDPFEMTQEELIEQALQNEDEGNLPGAIEWYRIVMARFGPQAEIHFQLAELLYREGEVQAARERYYAAIEADEDFVEARANLGCVLAETGRLDLAIAAFRGALARYDAYPDVHYHLARALDDSQMPQEADKHWARFVELAPGSPWLEEALLRLGTVRG